MYGKKSMGTACTTFVIGEDGKVAEVITKVDTQRHAEQLLEVLECRNGSVGST
jgi:peroxiredoxin Q/BCP